ncbi:MAG: FAD-binding protein, partial [Firmicutes bacterium]|nr:FAD-binding protein [Bacillota bacterium]
MKKLIKQLEKIVGCTWVVAEPSELDLYCYDASLDHGNADVVVFPENTLQVAAIIKLAKQAKIPFTPRGAGTGNSGGAVPQRGIVISTVRMRRIISIDPVNRLAVVEPGVINAELSNAISQYRLVFAPDPSSYLVSTLGGNAAENAGGPHCLKYGTTTDHIIALELVTPEGDIAEIGHSCADTPGPDWVGVLVGSEGLLSVITKLTLKLIPRPEEVCNILVGFRGIDEACQFMWSVLDKFTPATMEFMDRTTLGVLRETGKVIYPGDVSFVVLIEVDGYSEEVKRQARDIRDIAKTFKAHPIQIASSDEEREQIWAGRRGVGSALGRSAPARLSNDVCVPRSKLANIL